jgi:hypothetical protein
VEEVEGGGELEEEEFDDIENEVEVKHKKVEEEEESVEGV